MAIAMVGSKIEFQTRFRKPSTCGDAGPAPASGSSQSQANPPKSNASDSISLHHSICDMFDHFRLNCDVEIVNLDDSFYDIVDYDSSESASGSASTSADFMGVLTSELPFGHEETTSLTFASNDFYQDRKNDAAKRNGDKNGHEHEHQVAGLDLDIFVEKCDWMPISAPTSPKSSKLLQSQLHLLTRQVSVKAVPAFFHMEAEDWQLKDEVSDNGTGTNGGQSLFEMHRPLQLTFDLDFVPIPNTFQGSIPGHEYDFIHQHPYPHSHPHSHPNIWHNNGKSIDRPWLQLVKNDPILMILLVFLGVMTIIFFDLVVFLLGSPKPKTGAYPILLGWFRSLCIQSWAFLVRYVTIGHSSMLSISFGLQSRCRSLERYIKPSSKPFVHISSAVHLRVSNAKNCVIYFWQSLLDKSSNSTMAVVDALNLKSVFQRRSSNKEKDHWSASIGDALSTPEMNINAFCPPACAATAYKYGNASTASISVPDSGVSSSESNSNTIKSYSYPVHCDVRTVNEEEVENATDNKNGNGNENRSLFHHAHMNMDEQFAPVIMSPHNDEYLDNRAKRDAQLTIYENMLVSNEPYHPDADSDSEMSFCNDQNSSSLLVQALSPIVEDLMDDGQSLKFSDEIQDSYKVDADVDAKKNGEVENEHINSLIDCANDCGVVNVNTSAHTNYFSERDVDVSALSDVEADEPNVDHNVKVLTTNLPIEQDSSSEEGSFSLGNCEVKERHIHLRKPETGEKGQSSNVDGSQNTLQSCVDNVAGRELSSTNGSNFPQVKNSTSRVGDAKHYANSAMKSTPPRKINVNSNTADRFSCKNVEHPEISDTLSECKERQRFATDRANDCNRDLDLKNSSTNISECASNIADVADLEIGRASSRSPSTERFSCQSVSCNNSVNMENFVDDSSRVLDKIDIDINGTLDGTVHPIPIDAVTFECPTREDKSRSLGLGALSHECDDGLQSNASLDQILPSMSQKQNSVISALENDMPMRHVNSSCSKTLVSPRSLAINSAEIPINLDVPHDDVHLLVPSISNIEVHRTSRSPLQMEPTQKEIDTIVTSPPKRSSKSLSFAPNLKNETSRSCEERKMRSKFDAQNKMNAKHDSSAIAFQSVQQELFTKLKERSNLSLDMEDMLSPQDQLSPCSKMENIWLQRESSRPGKVKTPSLFTKTKHDSSTNLTTMQPSPRLRPSKNNFSQLMAKWTKDGKNVETDKDEITETKLFSEKIPKKILSPFLEIERAKSKKISPLDKGSVSTHRMKGLSEDNTEPHLSFLNDMLG